MDSKSFKIFKENDNFERITNLEKPYEKVNVDKPEKPERETEDLGEEFVKLKKFEPKTIAIFSEESPYITSSSIEINQLSLKNAFAKYKVKISKLDESPTALEFEDPVGAYNEISTSGEIKKENDKIILSSRKDHETCWMVHFNISNAGHLTKQTTIVFNIESPPGELYGTAVSVSNAYSTKPHPTVSSGSLVEFFECAASSQVEIRVVAISDTTESFVGSIGSPSFVTITQLM